MKKKIFYTTFILFCLVISPQIYADDYFEIDQSGTPKRVEKKSFSNISDIEIDHSYGDIFVRESNSNQVELEIQYFENGLESANYEASVTNRTLSIKTVYSKKGSNKLGPLGSLGTQRGDDKSRINYIINIPRNTGLNVNLSYGNIKMNPFQGIFVADLSYSDLSAQSITGSSPSIKVKYGKVSITNVPDIVISASYSEVKINKANNINISGNYNDYTFSDAHSITTDKSSSYGDMKIASVTNMNINMLYSDVKIDNLISNLEAVCSYSDIKINNVSPKLSNISIKGTYSDIAITLPPDISVAFDVDMNYGDLDISKRHNVTYTRQSETDMRTVKIGKIGSKTPTGKIVVKNTYGDIKIK